MRDEGNPAGIPLVLIHGLTGAWPREEYTVKAYTDFIGVLVDTLNMLGDGTCYHDLGPHYFARRDPNKTSARLANRIRNLGYHVELNDPRL